MDDEEKAALFAKLDAIIDLLQVIANNSWRSS